MAAHEICFDFYYQSKPKQIRQNNSAVADDDRLTDCISQIRILTKQC
jgi:hypothetical protein